jgi:hypothetical protein
MLLTALALPYTWVMTMFYDYHTTIAKVRRPGLYLISTPYHSSSTRLKPQHRLSYTGS